MPTYLKWLIGVVAGVLILGLAALGAYFAWFVVRPAAAGPSVPWTGPGMMGRWNAGGQVEWNTQAGVGGCGVVGAEGRGTGSPGDNLPACHTAGGTGASNPPTTTPLTLPQARQVVEQYIASYYGNSDLAVDEVMEFDLNFYAIVKEKTSHIGAFEVLVDKWSGAVRPEPGPNMMWNARYGMMGNRGMMGWGYAGDTGTMQYSPEQARATAQQWLDQNLPGVEARPDDVDAFYGYYTLHVWKDGQIYGMLSVNGSSGQIWYHSWHGKFIAMLEGEGG